MQWVGEVLIDKDNSDEEYAWIWWHGLFTIVDMVMPPNLPIARENTKGTNSWSAGERLILLDPFQHCEEKCLFTVGKRSGICLLWPQSVSTTICTHTKSYFSWILAKYHFRPGKNNLWQRNTTIGSPKISPGLMFISSWPVEIEYAKDCWAPFGRKKPCGLPISKVWYHISYR